MGRPKKTEPNPPCTECGAESKCKGLCERHYAAMLRRKHPERIAANRKRYRSKPENRATERASAKRYVQSHPRKMWDTRYRYCYGVSFDEYEAMLVAQEGRCAVCRSEHAGGRWKRLHVDHDHATGKVRGLLCHNCNLAIGLLRDDPDRLLRAVEYLKR